jgi:hypothetical protein
LSRDIRTRFFWFPAEQAERKRLTERIRKTNNDSLPDLWIICLSLSRDCQGFFGEVQCSIYEILAGRLAEPERRIASHFIGNIAYGSKLYITRDCINPPG